jgi:GNAT superfamily N-acetyltransferase
MTTTLTIRQAEPADLDTVEQLRAEATDWLASKGLDQWQRKNPRFPSRERAANAIDRGACYLAYDADGVLVGTITVDDQADPEFWTSAEQAQPALYVHRMIVAREAAGQNVGGQLLDWAATVATSQSRPTLRLDCWARNRALHRYYAHQGFVHLRTMRLSHRGSGALFQKSVAP